jgi:UDP-galactopyranose mutase
MRPSTIGVAGAGLTGAVIARELAEHGECRVYVFEEREHVAGNCHTERDARSGVMNHVYGAHVFHTSRQDIWNYVNRFERFRPYCARIKAVTHRGVFSLPINLLTINQFFGETFSPKQAEAFIRDKADLSIENPRSFEEQALRFMGRELYEAFFRGYTRKQWGVDPSELPASILKRLPLRFNYNDDYFSDTYQGIPEGGYTEMVRRILDHPNIEVRLGERLDLASTDEFDHVFWSGPLDAYFDHSLGRLRYRTLRFERLEGVGDYQGAPVVTYCDEAIPYNRIFEYKHLTPWEEHELTEAYRQYSADAGPGDTPYYPLRLLEDKALLADYSELAKAQRGVTFAGRLGTYRYLDMHVVIGEALEIAKRFLTHAHAKTPFPAFVVDPNAAPMEKRTETRS